MKRLVDSRSHLAKRSLPTLAAIAWCMLSSPSMMLVGVAHAAPAATVTDKAELAREQFLTAVRKRTMLEGFLEKDRSASDYKQTIDAYQKVYDLDTEADEVPASFMAEAELYEEMGRLFDGKYFDSAVKTYQSLLDQYPSSRYRSSALYAIGQIQQFDQNKPDAAQETYRDLLKKLPGSEHAADARKALKDIAAAMTARSSGMTAPPAVASADLTAAPLVVQNSKASAPAPGQTFLDASDDPSIAGVVAQPRESDRGLAVVKELKTTNSVSAARVVLTLNDTVDFQSARIASPDRIYFNISRATLSLKASSREFDDPKGLIRSVRVAQNKPDVVRVVLDAPSAKDFNAYLLSKPYRLVIELGAKDNSVPQHPIASAIAPQGTMRKETVADAASTAPSGSSSSGRPHEAPVSLNRRADVPSGSIAAPAAPKPMNDGDTSLTRALGLKIHRIVIDPGHGGHDTGTVGRNGLMEKDLCLDVGLRLGREIQQKLPEAEVVYTRQDDTFIPLEERTRIANDAKADLFISIHANSSPDETARGVETYYLNFSTSDDAMEVAARENAASQQSLHDLQDIIKKIARNDKIEESKQLAGDIQSSLAHKLQVTSPTIHNRGVKQAPFVVLIGADMPSILAEISFVSNPTDERLLKNIPQRQKIADGLFRGITNYLDSLNSLSMNQQKSADAADNRLEARNNTPSAPNAK